MIAAITSLIVGGISLVGKMTYAQMKSRALQDEAKDNMEIVKTNQKYLTDQYEAAKKLADWDWDNTQNVLGQNMAITKQSQLTNAKINAMQGVANEKATFQNLAYTIESAKAQKGAAVQQTAVTGFRNAKGTTVGKSLANTQGKMEEIIDSEKESAMTSVSTAYMQARSNYLSAEYNYRQYLNNLVAAGKQYETQTITRKNEYDYQYAQLQDQYEQYKKASKKDTSASILFGMDPGSDISSMASSLNTIATAGGV